MVFNVAGTNPAAGSTPMNGNTPATAISHPAPLRTSRSASPVTAFSPSTSVTSLSHTNRTLSLPAIRSTYSRLACNGLRLTT